MEKMDYAKEVESFLVAKRNSGLMIFHKEWLLIEKWESMGIPVNIVKDGIDNAIEGLNFSKKGKVLTVPTLEYCEKYVLKYWKNFKENKTGKSEVLEEIKRPENYNQDFLNFLQSLRRKIEEEMESIEKKNSSIAEELKKMLFSGIEKIEEKTKSLKIKNIEKLVEEIESLDCMVLNKTKQLIDEKTFLSLREECEKKLLPYRKKMEEKDYNESLKAMVDSRLRRKFGFRTLLDIDF